VPFGLQGYSGRHCALQYPLLPLPWPLLLTPTSPPGPHRASAVFGSGPKVAFRKVQCDQHGLKPRRFVSLAVRVVSTEDQALQALGVPCDTRRNSLPSRRDHMRQAVYHFNHLPMNQCIGFGQFCITPACLPEEFELRKRVAAFVPEECASKTEYRSATSATVLFRIRHAFTSSYLFRSDPETVV
jgi:hypothetical protein